MCAYILDILVQIPFEYVCVACLHFQIIHVNLYKLNLVSKINCLIIVEKMYSKSRQECDSILIRDFVLEEPKNLFYKQNLTARKQQQFFGKSVEEFPMSVLSVTFT